MATAISNVEGKCKYIKDSKESLYFRKVSFAYLFSLYVMPQYFGIQLPFFDLTIVRFMIIIMAVFIISSNQRLTDFGKMLKTEKVARILLPYLFVVSYTMVFRADLKAFLNPFFEILEMFLLIYSIRDALGTKQTIRCIIGFLYLLTILGIVEAIFRVSPFSYLVTIPGLYTGRFIRGGHYRIMSNCNHSLGYGLLLVTALPFAAYDYEKEEFDALFRPVLLALMIVNVFLTGSRSSLGVAIAEVFFIFALSDIKYLRRNLLAIVGFGISFFMLLMLFQRTSVGRYILLQLTSLIDSFCGTEFSIKYGSNLKQLVQSAHYRKLIKKVYKVSWLNPLVGIGRKRGFSSVIDGLVVKSIDNFYIAEYVRYAYPGLIANLLFMAYMVLNMVCDAVRTRSALIRALLIGTVFYCLHLEIADSLQTLKYLYIIFGLYICADKKEYVPETDPCRYIKKRKLRYA